MAPMLAPIAIFLAVACTPANAFLIGSNNKIHPNHRQHHQRFFYEDGSTLSMTSKTSDMCVDELLDQVTSEQPDREAIQELITSLSNTTEGATTTTTSTNDDESAADMSHFEPLLGYYNVSYTLTARPKDNPVGGKWTRLWKVRRMLQHVLPAENTATTKNVAVVAQVVNAIRLELLFGMIGIWVVLRGDAVPLTRDEADKAAAAEKEEQPDKSSKKGSPPLLPNLSDRTVRVYFDKPRIGLSLFRPHKANSDSNKALLAKRVLTLGPTSSVVLDTPYIDDRIRLGKGGTSGSQFVFARVPEDDKEAADGWKWVTKASLAALNKTQIMLRVGVLGILSSLAFRLLQHTVMKRIAGVSAIISGIILAWLASSTGGIETRGDTYTRGR